MDRPPSRAQGGDYTPAMALDPYAALGVPKTADQAAIRRAFRTLAQKYHPDRNKEPGAEQKFKEVSAAHEILGDEDRRTLFDEFGEDSLRTGFNADQARAWKAQGGGRGFPGFESGGVDLDELLRGFGGGGRRAPTRGPDIEGRIDVGLLDALRGNPVPVTVMRPVNCRTCVGAGGVGQRACSTCNGTGRRQVKQRAGNMIVACNECGATGQVFETECVTCEGTGRSRERHSVSVTLPAGIDDGQTIRMRGQGAEGKSGSQPGDLLLTIHITEHPFLRRKDADLEMDLPVSLAEAVGGGPVEVPLPMGGKIKLPVPAGARNGQRLRVRGKGVAGGDLYLVVRPVMPGNTPEAVDLARQLDGGADPRAGWGL